MLPQVKSISHSLIFFSWHFSEEKNPCNLAFICQQKHFSIQRTGNARHTHTRFSIHILEKFRTFANLHNFRSHIQRITSNCVQPSIARTRLPVTSAQVAIFLLGKFEVMFTLGGKPKPKCARTPSSTFRRPQHRLCCATETEPLGKSALCDDLQGPFMVLEDCVDLNS